MNLPVRTQIAELPSNNKFGHISKEMDTRKASLRIQIFSLPQSPATMDKIREKRGKEWNSMKCLQMSERNWSGASISHLFIWLFNPMYTNTYIWQWKYCLSFLVASWDNLNDSFFSLYKHKISIQLKLHTAQAGTERIWVNDHCVLITSNVVIMNSPENNTCKNVAHVIIHTKEFIFSVKISKSC